MLRKEAWPPINQRRSPVDVLAYPLSCSNAIVESEERPSVSFTETHTIIPVIKTFQDRHGVTDMVGALTVTRSTHS